MAYRNHPTRYLIVKDRVASPAVAGGQQEAATYAARVPVSSTFFQTPPTRLPAAAFRFPEAEGVSTRPRPARQALFFSITVSPVWRSGRVAVFRSAEGASTHPRAARQHFFSLAPRNRCPSVRVAGLPRRGGACLRSPTRPVNAFFQVPPRFLATPGRARRGFPQRGLSGLLALPPDCQLPFTHLPQMAQRQLARHVQLPPASGKVCPLPRLRRGTKRLWPAFLGTPRGQPSTCAPAPTGNSCRHGSKEGRL